MKVHLEIVLLWPVEHSLGNAMLMMLPYLMLMYFQDIKRYTRLLKTTDLPLLLADVCRCFCIFVTIELHLKGLPPMSTQK